MYIHTLKSQVVLLSIFSEQNPNFVISLHEKTQYSLEAQLSMSREDGYGMKKTSNILCMQSTCSLTSNLRIFIKFASHKLNCIPSKM